MEWILGFVFVVWIITRETKVRCDFCGCKRKLKYIHNGLYGTSCDGGCLHVAFITGKPVMKNGQIEVEYNWDSR